DDKASIQLLGNLSIQNIRSQTLGIGGKELRKLERLVLEKGSILTLGPYMWFRFITESLAIETAKLITEYNSTCIPLKQLHLASPEARKRFEDFVEDHKGSAETSLPRGDRGREARAGEVLSNASFTAFDFLGPTRESDAAVRHRYGDEVLKALKRDRRAVIRDVFGTR
ncbi:hypothetical protein, partial [Streptococcus pseudopneumoniae]|uniref:hypothetical protein n=1 Tax=Streptococcus pseudopneumoniae TaxID=257758 RepID=UPI0014873268